MRWKTSISKIEPNHIVTKGYRQQDLIGNVPFTSVVYLLLRGTLPSMNYGKMMDAIMTSCIRDRPGQKVQDIGKQVSVRARHRVRVVKMDAEAKQ